MATNSMPLLSLIFLLVGGVVSIVGSLWMLIEAFRTSLLWGLAYLIVPFAALVWIILHFDQAARPLFLSIAGGGVMFLAFIFMP